MTASSVDTAPIKTEFVRFANRDGPRTIDGETRAIGEESKTQGLVFRFENHGAHPAGCFNYNLHYFDAASHRLDVDDRSGGCSIAWEVAAGERKEVRLQPNHQGIPKLATRVELQLTKICEMKRERDGIGFGPCWWIGDDAP